MSGVRTLQLAFGVAYLFVAVGCASVEPERKPLNAMELSGVVSDATSVPYTGLSAGQYGAVYSAGGVAGVMVASRIDSQSGNRNVSSIVVAVSQSLSLTVPVEGSFKQGECVKLFIDPIYRDILSRKDVPVMSMAVGSTFVQRVAC